MQKKRVDSTIVYLELEKSKIKREKAKLVLDKSVFLYFAFLLIGFFGFAFNYINSFILNMLVICGIIVLVIGAIPYMRTVSAEEKKIDNFLRELK